MKPIFTTILCLLTTVMLLISLSAGYDVIGMRKIEIAKREFEKQFERDIASGKNGDPVRLSPGGPDPHHH